MSFLCYEKSSFISLLRFLAPREMTQNLSFRMDTNYGDNELGICASSDIKSSDGNGFTIAVCLNYGSLHQSTTGEEFIHNYIDDASGDCKKQAWFESHLRQTFPDAKFTEGKNKQTLHRPTLSPQTSNETSRETSREKLENIFRKNAFEVLDKLLPKLIQLHKDGILYLCI